jgi:hypothetical protein
MSQLPPEDQLKDECLGQFASLVDSVGVKRFAMCLGLSTRQVNRILSGVQPNPVERLIRALQSAEAECGDRVLDYVCQEMGGHFVRQEALDEATVNAVKECAEAIAAISDGEISDLDVREIREAISALSGLIMGLRDARRRPDSGEERPPPSPPPPPPCG